MIQVVGESIKNGLILAAMNEFPGTFFYKEQITSPAFPNIFILQLTLTQREERKGYFWLTYLVSLRYRVAGDIALVPNLQFQLDDAGLRLMLMNEIQIAGAPVKITNPRYEKVDGVLHYFCNINIQVTKPRIEEIKMWNLEIEQHLKRR